MTEHESLAHRAKSMFVPASLVMTLISATWMFARLAPKFEGAAR